jgi:hypothetical protein
MQMTRNILRIYRSATPEQHAAGMAWYPLAYDIANEYANGDVWKGAGVIAAFSPQTPWERNVELAIDSLQSGVARTETLGGSVVKAQRILDGEHPLDVLGGQKTLAFADNIAHAGESRIVTVDVHAHNLAHGYKDSKASIGKRLYADISEAYTRAARREGIRVTEMQAITWVVWRAMFDSKGRPIVKSIAA